MRHWHQMAGSGSSRQWDTPAQQTTLTRNPRTATCATVGHYRTADHAVVGVPRRRSTPTERLIGMLHPREHHGRKPHSPERPESEAPSPGTLFWDATVHSRSLPTARNAQGNHSRMLPSSGTPFRDATDQSLSQSLPECLVPIPVPIPRNASASRPKQSPPFFPRRETIFVSRPDEKSFYFPGGSKSSRR